MVIKTNVGSHSELHYWGFGLVCFTVAPHQLMDTLH